MGPAGFIPKSLHFIWLQGEDDLKGRQPAYWENVGRARSLLPSGWSVTLWSEPAIKELMLRLGPEIWPRYQSIQPMAMKADLARFCILHAYGGIYLDIDFLVRKDLSPLASLSNEPYLALRRWRVGTFVHSLLNGTFNPNPKSLQTYILVSPPRHPIWMTLIEHILTFRARRILEPKAIYYSRFTCVNALGKAVDQHIQSADRHSEVIYITQLSDHYGSHVGKGEWAGMLTTYGSIRHDFTENLSWTLFLSLALNVVLLIAASILLAARF